MRIVLAVALALSGIGQANAAIITRAYSLTASDFINFNGTPSPITSLSVTFELTYDDTVSGFVGAPASFNTITNGIANVGPFAATPVFGYFPAAGPIAPFPRLGVGGALNGGNALVNGTDDFYFTFDASAASPTNAMLSFTSASYATPFIATNAIVTRIAAVAPVPEPATWAMMLVGFGAIGFAMRRRKVKTTVSYA
jgi:hypothetical protein